MVQEIQLQDIPFKLNTKQVFYVEKKEDTELNAFIRENYDRLRKIFRRRRLQFIYLPIAGEEIVRYEAPFLDEEKRNRVIAALNIATYIHDEDFPPSLVFSGAKTQDQPNILNYVPIDSQWFTSAEPVFKSLAREIQLELLAHGLNCVFEVRSITVSPGEEVKYGSSFDRDLPLNRRRHPKSASMRVPDLACFNKGFPEPQPVRAADATFNEESKKIIKEIQQRIDALREMGVDTLFLHKLIDEDKKLSRLHITKDKRIFLPDYNNMEIQMQELPKAVFLLFLYHPEGIRFKDLPDYRGELLTIYRSLSPRGSRARQEKSICDVTDPMSNSINEKCARIREAFVSQFDDQLACNYYITGKQGEAKYITLDDDLITIDE